MKVDRRKSLRIPAQGARPQLLDAQLGPFLRSRPFVLEDLSPEGLRGRWDQPLPEDQEFRLRLHFQEPAQFRARVVWQRILPGGGVLVGVSFTPLSEADAASLARHLETMQASTRRRSARVAYPLPINLFTADGKGHLTALATDLGMTGLCALHATALPQGQEVIVMATLGGGPPVEVRAVVRWARPSEEQGQGHLMGLEFVDPSPTVLEEIRIYLEHLPRPAPSPPPLAS